MREHVISGMSLGRTSGIARVWICDKCGTVLNIQCPICSGVLIYSERGFEGTQVKGPAYFCPQCKKIILGDEAS
jgi:primosomal protein N'